MIHRFEVDPPQTTILIYADPSRDDRDRPSGTMFEVDRYINCRMIGGRTEFGEHRGPCIFTIDDDTEAGQWELEQVRERLAGGKMPGVRPYEPSLGVSDDAIEAMVQRRLTEELARRGYVEQPSEEIRELFEDVEAPAPSYAPPQVDVVPFSAPYKVEQLPHGRLRCPLDRRVFKEGQSWTLHWQRSTDPEHGRLADAMIAVSV